MIQHDCAELWDATSAADNMGVDDTVMGCNWGRNAEF